MELTTVGDDVAVVHDGTEVRRYEGLEPDTVHELDGFAFRTLARPGGELLCRFATVNDVHFGETVCGMIEGLDMGPIFSSPDGEPPYPETMNSGAIAEISAIDPEVVVVKGNTPAMAVLRQKGITRLRGNWTQAWGKPVLPMLHPAYLLRNPIAKREAWADLLSLQAHLAANPPR